MRKGLLILVGGRPLPNMLTVIHEKPEVIVAIVSHDETWRMDEFHKSIDVYAELSGYRPIIINSYVVDAFELQVIKATCLSAIQEYSDCDWIVNITSATKIMGIGAYEAATDLSDRDISIRCWYLDTQHNRVIAPVGNSRDSEIFKVTMDEYAAAYNCKVGTKDAEFTDENQRRYCQEHWTPFAQFLVENCDYMDVLKDLLKVLNGKGVHKPAKEQVESYPIKVSIEQARPLLELAERVQLIKNVDWEMRTFSLNDAQVRFLEGAWLEVYVWSEAQKLSCFDYCGWNQELLVGNRMLEKDPDNELDVTLLYNAQLIVVECKDRKKSFDASFLSSLVSAVHPLGENAVTKIFVTSQPIPSTKDRNIMANYDKFKEKAQDKRILVVTRENLPNIGSIIAKQIKQAAYSRS